MSCEQPFWNDPVSLFTKFSLTYEPTCPHQRYNFVARMVLVALVVGSLGTAVCGSMSIVICLLLAAVIGAIIVVQGQEEKAAYDIPVKVEIEEVQLTPGYVSPGRLEGFTA